MSSITQIHGVDSVTHALYNSKTMVHNRGGFPSMGD